MGNRVRKKYASEDDGCGASEDEAAEEEQRRRTYEALEDMRRRMEEDAQARWRSVEANLDARMTRLEEALEGRLRALEEAIEERAREDEEATWRGAPPPASPGPARALQVLEEAVDKLSGMCVSMENRRTHAKAIVEQRLRCMEAWMEEARSQTAAAAERARGLREALEAAAARLRAAEAAAAARRERREAASGARDKALLAAVEAGWRRDLRRAMEEERDTLESRLAALEASVRKARAPGVLRAEVAAPSRLDRRPSPTPPPPPPPAPSTPPQTSVDARLLSNPATPAHTPPPVSPSPTLVLPLSTPTISSTCGSPSMAAVSTVAAPAATPRMTATTLATASVVSDDSAAVRPKDEGSAMLRAAAKGSIQEVRLLLSRMGARNGGSGGGGRGIEARDGSGDSPLHAAALHGHTHVVRLLMEFGADVDARGCRGRTPLHDAARGCHADVVLALTAGVAADGERGDVGAAGTAMRGPKADVDARDEDGWTPLHYAASWSGEACVRALLAAGANAAAGDARGRTAERYARSDVVRQLLLKYEANHQRKMAEDHRENTKAEFVLSRVSSARGDVTPQPLLKDVKMDSRGASAGTDISAPATVCWASPAVGATPGVATAAAAAAVASVTTTMATATTAVAASGWTGGGGGGDGPGTALGTAPGPHRRRRLSLPSGAAAAPPPPLLWHQPLGNTPPWPQGTTPQLRRVAFPNGPRCGRPPLHAPTLTQRC